MPVFDFFKRLVGSEPASSERRLDDRIRTTLRAHILVVDDSATIRAVLGKMLAQDGYHVVKAADGEGAIEMAHIRVPDLIFLDIVLPRMSGFAALRALRRDARTRNIPIVMMSGNQQATEQFYVQRFGADGFIRKPFGRTEVFHAIRSLVQAGRMPARVEAAAVGVIPDGMTADEWDAIPDVAMPDEAHMAPEAHTPASDVRAQSAGPTVTAVAPVPGRAPPPAFSWISPPIAGGRLQVVAPSGVPGNVVRVAAPAAPDAPGLPRERRDEARHGDDN